MNIFGIGAAELLIIFLLMLVVAGPKRMMRWAYVAGQYVAKLRAMWAETSAILKRELEQAGLEPEVVDTLQELTKPRALRKANPLDKLVDEMKKPVEDALKPVENVIQEVKEASSPDTRAEATPAGVADSTGAATRDDGTAAIAQEESSDSSGPAENVPGRYDAWTPN